MEQLSQFEQSVAEAYDHLYDLMFLRTHPLSRNRIERAIRVIEKQDFPYGK